MTDLWWEYIHEVHRTCNSVINEGCSKLAHRKLDLSFSTTRECVEKSFTNKDWKESTAHNDKIDQQIEYWRQFGTNIYPSVVINQKTYRGQIEPLSVFNAICAGFTDPPK